MDRRLFCTSLLLVMAPGIGAAQGHDDRGNHGGPPGGGHQGGHGGGGGPHGGGGGPHGGPGGGGGPEHRAAQHGGPPPGGGGGRSRAEAEVVRGSQGPSERRSASAGRPSARPSTGGRGARPPGGTHRPGEGRPAGFRPIHGGAWRYPSGYHYRHWSIGLFLPSIFLGSAYAFYDWGLLGLEPPPPGYRWVRYGPDLLLVDRYTGRIADVIYGAFY